MSEPYGFDAQKFQLQKLAIQQGQQQIETGEIEQQKSQLELSLAKKAFESQQEVEAMLHSMPDLTKDLSDDPAGTMAKIAGVLVAKGQVGAAVEVLGKSATARKDSEIAAKNQLDTRIKQGQHISAAMANVKDANDWNAAVAGMMMLYPDAGEHLMDLANLPNDTPGFNYEEAAKRISAGALTEVEKARKMQLEAAAEASRQASAEHKVNIEQLIPSQVLANKARAEHLKKLGGKNAKTATITDAKNLIKSKYEIEDPEAGVLAAKVAEDAENILRSQPTLGRTEALKQAFAEAERDNAFAGADIAHTTKGTKASAPLDIPETKDLLKVNKFYRGRGAFASKVYIWTGKEFKLYTEAK